MLRVATWNIWGRFGPWEERFGAIVAAAAALDVDVLCLQEVWFGRDGSHQAPLLADALGWPTWTAAPIVLPEALDVGVTNAVLSRWPLLQADAEVLPGPTGAPSLRSVVHARLAHPEAELDVFTTHLDHRADASATRQAQARHVAGYVARRRSHPEVSFPPILTGDLNAVPTADEVRLLTGEMAVPVPGLVFLDAWASAGDGGPGTTWSRANPWLGKARAPDRRLDYVLVGWPYQRGQGQVLSCRVAATEPVDGLQPSDHFAVVAELRTAGDA